MKEIKNDLYYLKRIVYYIDKILEYVENINDNNSEMMPDDQDSDGVLYKFIQLREESKKVSNEFLEKNPSIKQIFILLNGFRNRITHDYENVSYSFIDEIVEYDLPILKSEITNLISNNL